jgi:hypothetical protein
MIPNLDKIRQVAEKDGYAKEIGTFIDSLSSQDVSKALYVARTLFFAPETHPRVRYTIGERLGKLGNHQLFTQILSYFILQSFPDRMALISSLRSFGNREAIPALIEYYPLASYRECLEIIEALATIQAPEAVEFLSSIYNEQVNYRDSYSPKEIETIRERSSSALSRTLMRFDFL